MDVIVGAGVVDSWVVGGDGGLERLRGEVGSAREGGTRSFLGLSVGLGNFWGGGIDKLDAVVVEVDGVVV